MGIDLNPTYDPSKTGAKALKGLLITVGSVAAATAIGAFTDPDFARQVIGTKFIFAIPLVNSLAIAALNWLKHR